ncbi:voltage-gated chloride channel family protein [Chryseobacterium potabilaquae]|uniref:Chloride/fluoride channel protein n=1 Tax=Chryseobacterium potabilaquae TaxID=2675057 RepID=A0A6N4X0Y2_9FLAO|nr:voltage-gated chloride channel family protein [Chryseobacterium potabilaquae]CAA7194448.1 Chloride/fluoride channel protein [Chryseobacterium potabilaquae]
MTKHQRTVIAKIQFHSRFFFRKFPSFPYIIKWLFIALMIGSLIGSASAAFLQSLEWVTHFRESHIWLIAFLPIAGFLIGTLYHYLGKDIESGNNLLIDTIDSPTKVIPFKMAPLVYLGTITTHLFGGSAGREGTALQMAGAIADQFSKPLKLNQEDRKVLIIAAIAAGFGSVFGTPLAGAVFALEVFMIGKIRYQAIFPAFIASIIADWITNVWQVKHIHYAINFVPTLEPLPILYSIVSGAVFGICAASFSKAIHWAGSQFKTKIKYPPFRPFIGGSIVAIAVFAIGTTKYIGLGIPTIIDSFKTQVELYDFLLKICFTILTLSSGFKGGEVTPLFFIGATLGNALSLFIPLPFDLLTGMGFVAVFAGATNTPIACLFMGIELFGVDCGVYIAIACIVSYLFSGHTSIYNRQKIGEAKSTRYKTHQDKTISEIK